MRNLAHLASRLFNEPLAIRREKLDVLRAVFQRSLDNRHAAILPMEVEEPERETSQPAPEAIAVIPVLGTLVFRNQGMQAASGMTSYMEMQSQLRAAQGQAVKGVILDLCTDGGEAAGMCDISDDVAALSASKPVYAVVRNRAFSAGYAIAAGATRIYVGRDCGVGSIGIRAVHCDESKADAMAGLKYTEITYGDRKSDGSPHAPLSDGALAEMEARVDRAGELFVTTVAKNRHMSVESVKATQAACYFGADAIAAGLADQIGGMEDALRDMAAAVGLDKPEAPEPEPEPEPIPGIFGKSARAPRDSAIAGWSARVHAAAVASGIAKETDRLEVRSAPALRSSALITGCFAPYGELSGDLGGFREEYAPGCFADSMASDDIRAYFNHDPAHVLGRKSANTLRLSEAAAGAQIEIDAPATTWADDLGVSMGRGDINQMSCAFFIQQHKMELRGGSRVRVIERARLVEVSVHADPAYAGTSAKFQPHAAVTNNALAKTSLAAHAGPQAELEVIRQRFDFAQYV